MNKSSKAPLPAENFYTSVEWWNGQTNIQWSILCLHETWQLELNAAVSRFNSVATDRQTMVKE